MVYNKVNIFCFLLVGVFSILTLAEDEKFEDKTSFFEPTEYSLTITTKDVHYKDNNTEPFEGVVNIKLKKKNANLSNDIKVELDADPKMTEVKAEFIAKKNISGTHEGKKIFFSLSKDLYEGNDFEIKVSFKAPFRDDMTGFYRSFYKDNNNSTRWLLTTHFEPIYARRAFPCFDTPNLKAFFNISIKIPLSMDKYFALSNTPCMLKKDGKYLTYVCEKAEVPMSTYLVAFTVSDFGNTPEVKFESNYLSTIQQNKTLKTYGQKNFIDKKQGELSQNAAKEAITKLTEYLQLGYALKKLDQIGIPDFTAGAMENWGLITYRENKIFFDSAIASKMTEQGNVLTITHELVHQWFGNLVSPETWDNIWLNEAFATYLQYLIGSQLKNPDTSKWECLKQHVINEIHLRAFEADGISSSKELSYHIKDEDMIFSFFNDISYSKGSAVLRMWDLSLPKETFKKSLNRYLNARKEKSANPDQLYEAFKASMKEAFFKSWVNQPGYPVVEVKKVNNSYTLTQSRFLWEEQNNGSNTIWELPLTHTTDKSGSEWKTETASFLNENSGKIDVVNASWIILNNQQAGYYRVNYDEENWEALAKVLKTNFSKIHELNRAQILNDIFSLARSLQKNYVKYSTAMSLAEYLKKETSFFPWKTALNAFGFLQTKLYKDEIYPQFKSYVLELIKDHCQDLDLNKLGHIETLKAVEICRWACSLDGEPCVTNAINLYEKKSFPKDSQEIILCTAVRKLTNATNEVLKSYTETQDSSLKIMYLSVLGCTDNEKFLDTYLKKTLENTTDIRKQDYSYVLSSVYNGNLNNVKVAFEFVNKYYKNISSNYGGTNPLGRALVGIAKKLDSQEELKKMEELGKIISKEISAAKESVESALSIIKSNNQWTKKKKSEFHSFFKSAGSLASFSFALLSLCLAFVFAF